MLYLQIREGGRALNAISSGHLCQHGRSSEGTSTSHCQHGVVNSCSGLSGGQSIMLRLRRWCIHANVRITLRDC